MKNKIIILIAILSLVLTSVQFTVVVDAAKPFESLSETEMIEKMLEKEVVANKDDGLFHAEEEISKEDFINMTARLFNITDENKSEKLLQNNVISQKFIDDESSVVPNEKAAVVLAVVSTVVQLRKHFYRDMSQRIFSKEAKRYARCRSVSPLFVCPKSFFIPVEKFRNFGNQFINQRI